MLIRENVEIANLTTMRLGGKARYVADIENKDDLVEAYTFARKQGLPVYILGSGSNIIGRDEGFSGVVLVNRMKGIEVLKETGSELILKGYGGEKLDDFT